VVARRSSSFNRKPQTQDLKPHTMADQPTFSPRKVLYLSLTAVGCAAVLLAILWFAERSQLLRQARRVKPADPFTQGVAYFEMKLYRDAIPHLKEALARKPNDPEIHYYLGAAHSHERTWRDAIWHLERAVVISPSTVKYEYELGKAYAGAGLYEMVIKSCERLLKLEPLNGKAHNLLGYAYGRLRQYDKARLHFTLAISIDPNDQLAARNLEALGKPQPRPKLDEKDEDDEPAPPTSQR
jgi:tetratricopeptide (TPR) repeat protein